jgi:hypothetical protein
MIAQTAGLYNYAGAAQYHAAKDIEEKDDTGSKVGKKETDVLVSCFLLLRAILLNRAEYSLSPVIIISSPVIDHLAPPPDRKLEY